MRSRLLALGTLAILLVASRANAQTSFPMITHVTPVAVQRGKTTEVTVHNPQKFNGAYKALFEGAGIVAEVVPEPPDTKVNILKVKLKLTVAADARLGVRE